MSIAATTGDPESLRQAALNIRRFYAYRFIINFQLWMPIWVIYLQFERGLTLAQIFLLEAMFELMFIVFEVPTGVVADRWGRKFSILLGAIGSVGAVALFAFAPSFWWVALSYFVWAISITLMSGADTAFLHDSLAAQRREGEFARVIGRGNACATGAFMVSATIGAPLAALTNLTVPVVASIGLAALTVPVVLAFHEPRRRETGPKPGYFQLMRHGVGYALSRPRLRAVIVLGALVQGLSFAVMTMTQPFLSHHGVPIGAFGLLITALSISAMSGALLSHRIAARLGARSAIYAACGLIAVAALVLGVVDAFGAFVAFAFLRFGLATFFPIVSELVNRDSTDDIRATVASMTTMGTSVTGAVAKPAMGAIADRSVISNAFLANAVAMVALGGLALLAWTRASRVPVDPAGAEVVAETA